MAITMSEAKVDDDIRQSLISSSIAGPSAGSNTSSITGIFGGTPVFRSGASGVNLAGIKPDFVNVLTKSIDNYINNADEALSKLTAVDSSSAFQGTQIKTALSNFVTGVREVGKSYLKALGNAENQIINSVHTVYQTQDSDLAGQIASDEDSLRSQSNPNGGDGSVTAGVPNAGAAAANTK